MSLYNASIRTRLLSLAGVSAVLILLLFATTRLTDRKVSSAYRSMDSAQQTIQSAREAIDAAGQFKDEINQVQQHVVALRLQEKTFLQFRTAKLKAGFDQTANGLKGELQKLNQAEISAEFQDYCKAFEERASLQFQHDDLNVKMAEPLQKSEKRLADILAGLDAKQSQLQMEGSKLRDDELEMMNVVRDCRIVFLKLQNLQQLFVATGDQAYFSQYQKVAATDALAGIRSLHEFATALGNTNYLAGSALIAASMDELKKSIEQSLACSTRETQLEQQLDAKGEAILKAAARQLANADQDVLKQKNSAAQAGETMQQVRAATATTQKNAGHALDLIMLAGLVISAVAGAKIIISINQALNRTIREMSDSARESASIATQVSTASQTLAEGASEQAASLEETSASLEEMSSMTKRNAENAQRANAIARQARQAADKGVADMQTMNSAMAAIKVSSDDIAKIIKTIDEIAFQTNILALNAAVEAARAGEAGMGFAVVADEVRNLAQRSAQAAKETAAKIEGAIGKTGQGVEISRKVAAALNEIVTKAREMDELAAEVANGSNEQAQGIVQVNAAVGQMDKVTQSNAVSAEESAAAAQELNAQAGIMKETVNQLAKLVGGSGETAADATDVDTGRSVKAPSFTRPLPAAVKQHHGNGRRLAAAKPASTARRGEIPLEGDFKNF